MKRYMEHYEYCSGLLEQRGGDWVKFKDAKTEIDSRDKRIAELEALLAHGTAARSEMLDEIHARGARIAELEALLASSSRVAVLYDGVLRDKIPEHLRPATMVVASARTEIDSRDKRIAELEAQLAEAKADADALRLAVDLEMTLELNASSSGAATRRGSWFYVAAAEAGSVLAATRCAIRHAAEAAA